MAVTLQIAHTAGANAINRDFYWYGFIIHHLEVDANGDFQPRVGALEIEHLGLTSSEEKRVAGGFRWPVDINNLLRQNKDARFTSQQIIKGFYVAFDDVEHAFEAFKLRTRIDLLLARKSGSKLFDLDMVASVSLFHDLVEMSLPIGVQHKSHALVYRTLFTGAPNQLLKETPNAPWVGLESFDGGIDKFLKDQGQLAVENLSISTFKTDIKVTVEVSQSELRERNLIHDFESVIEPKTNELEVVPPEVTIAPHVEPSAESAPNPLPPKPKTAFTWIAVAVAGVAVLFFVLLQQRGSPALVVNNTNQANASATVSQPSIGKQSAPVTPQAAMPPMASAPKTVEIAEEVKKIDIGNSIQIPQGTSVVDQSELYSFGFKPQLDLVKLILAATGELNTAEFDALTATLYRDRPLREWTKTDAVARKQFNEKMESMIVNAQAKNDHRELQAAISFSESFLKSHFGHSTAHLNLSMAQASAGNGKSALPPAFHSIVFNPDGANGWVALGVALAKSGDAAGATNAFCVALRKTNFSDRTVAFFDRVARGEDLKYEEVTRAMSSVYTACPRERWAKL